MNDTEATNAGIANEASNTFSAAQVLDYYDTSAQANPKDREFIKKRGFMEWLLANAIYDHAADVTAGISRKNISAPNVGQQRADLVILIANLIGGIEDE